MTKQVLQILLLFPLILLFERCAQVVPLNGGKRDMTPPKLVEAAPPDRSVNFNSDQVVLKFDEFIQVKDLPNQLIVSPKLKTAPQISADGKKITISFKKEELSPATTYRFSFGRAVVDMNEFNPIPNFEYVFSTGTFIDSLKLNGSISEAFNNRPSTGVLIGLYVNDEKMDSLPYLIIPDYITRSNESGAFAFANLPYKTFRVFGFTDKNKNNLYDGENEKIAFLGPGLKLNSDSTIRLKLFQEEASKSFIKRTSSPYFGFTQIFLNKKSRVKLSALHSKDRANITETFIDKEKDTVSLYYKDIMDTLALLLVNLSTKKTDTLKISIPKNNLAKKKFKSYALNTPGNKLLLHDKIRFTFLNWMDTTKANLVGIKFSSKEDSVISTIPVSGRWLGITSFEIGTKLKEGINYTLKIDTNTFFDLNHFSNDSGTVNFKTQNKLEFGKVTLKLRLNKKQNYIAQLIDSQEQVLQEHFFSFSLSSSNAVSIDFTDVTPGNYFVKIIYDDNKNKKWDTGDLLLKRQPETVIINSKQLKVLSDWEFEEEIIVRE